MCPLAASRTVKPKLDKMVAIRFRRSAVSSITSIFFMAYCISGSVPKGAAGTKTAKRLSIRRKLPLFRYFPPGHWANPANSSRLLLIQTGENAFGQLSHMEGLLHEVYLLPRRKFLGQPLEIVAAGVKNFQAGLGRLQDFGQFRPRHAIGQDQVCQQQIDFGFLL